VSEAGASAQAPASLVDRSFQLAYVVAYQLMRVYWGFRRPHTHGALVAMFHEGKILLIRNSYVRYYSLPGGYVRGRETSRQAAVRELAEEVGVTASAERLELALDEQNDWQGKRDHVQIFALEFAERPRVRIDRREVIEAEWFSRERALELSLFPPIRRLLERRAGAQPAG
jgi:ADP-ribose pyrophosphatase YjhB (NUDIX family)